MPRSLYGSAVTVPAELGSVLMSLALAAALYAAVAAFWSLRRNAPHLFRDACRGVYVAASCLALAVLLLVLAFLSDQFQIRYVAHHSSTSLPTHLKVAALWAGQEGSLLLWACLQSLCAALVMARPPGHARHLVPWALPFLSLTTAFFTALTLFLSNPFVESRVAPADGLGLHPLLRHPAMLLHPPTLYLGYIGLTVPFALAMAALVGGQIDRWPAAAYRWLLVAWLFLGLGLLLGARWAYDVLGGGGYWAWDPVENAGLMPWLTATALLHSLKMQMRRQAFRLWNVLLAALSLVLVLFGTFVTRSGVVESVHTFARSPLGYYLLSFVILTLAGSGALIIHRRKLLGSPDSTAGLLSRSSVLFLSLLIFVTVTATVFVGSTFPALTRALLGRSMEVTAAWFDRATGPQFAALVLLMGICPLTGPVATTLRQLRRRSLPVLAGAILTPVAGALAGFTRTPALLAFAVIGAAGAATLAECWDVLGPGKRTVLRVLQDPRWGGYLVHLGVALLASGIAGTRMYAAETVAVLSPGESIRVGRYTLVYEGLHSKEASDHTAEYASVAVYRGGERLATLSPRMEHYSTFDITRGVPAVRAGVWEDLYLVLTGWTDGGAVAAFKVFINPLTRFIWWGGMLLLIGGVVAIRGWGEW
ncbi:MAG: cytochrome c biogenesis protein CcsA [Anaerolineae bacterium]|nr:cytochrome c biogenesis protein CcsA [Anaerolineae bacterium]